MDSVLKISVTHRRTLLCHYAENDFFHLFLSLSICRIRLSTGLKGVGHASITPSLRRPLMLFYGTEYNLITLICSLRATDDAVDDGPRASSGRTSTARTPPKIIRKQR